MGRGTSGGWPERVDGFPGKDGGGSGLGRDPVRGVASGDWAARAEPLFPGPVHSAALPPSAGPAPATHGGPCTAAGQLARAPTPLGFLSFGCPGAHR